MQTLSPIISPTISKSTRGTDTETSSLPAIAQSAILHTAMSGLDASLNDELDRYRHWQTNGQTISYLNPFKPRAVSTQSIWTSPSLSDALSPIEPISESNIQSDVRGDVRTIQMPVMPPMGLEFSNNSSPNLSIAELHNYRGLEDLYRSESFTENGIAEDMQGYTDDDILQSFANDYPDQYHDSTPQEVEYPLPSAPNERSALQSLMNPVGIISLLLLLCSSAAIGYLIVDPSGVMKLFKPESRPKSTQVDDKGKGSSIGVNSQNQKKENDAGLSFVPFAADKTQLGNNRKPLVDPAAKTTKSSPKSSATTSNLFSTNSAFVPSVPSRTVPSTANSVAPIPSALAPIDNSYNAPVSRRSYEPDSAPVRTNFAEATPSRATSNSVVPTAPYVATRNSNNSVKYAAPLSSAPEPVTNSSYRVVVENSYATSAQQIERDAYVRPSDGQVQMGSYRDANAAQQKIEQLRRQGIPARIE
ncbi:MAG: hypothetical protein WCQ26_06265 [Pseudanabaena sp. ELA748]